MRSLRRHGQPGAIFHLPGFAIEPDGRIVVRCLACGWSLVWEEVSFATLFAADARVGEHARICILNRQN